MANNNKNGDQGSALLEDGEFWLPPQFLCDDETSPDESVFPFKFGGAAVGGFFPPAEHGTGWRTSNLSSPGESVVGSAEESDEEDFFADLTRKVAQSTLGDGFPLPRSSKGFYPSGSPKSTLCNGCGCGHASIRGNGAAQMKPAPPPTLDLLYQAAGKVADMRINQQRQQIERIRYLQQQQRLNHLIHLCDLKSEVSSHPYQVSSQQRLQFQPLQAWGSGETKYRKGDTMLSSSTWPTLQQARQPRREPVPVPANASGRATTGMRAVFLGSNNVYNRGSAGTGVFLPRRAGADPEPKRKQGCPTFLIPAKVVQALNLNLDEMGSQLPIQPRLDNRFASENDGAWRIRSGRQVTPQQLRSHHRLQPAVGQEISLPQEWTY